MFKSQMKFQKILCLAALIMAAVMFVYALGFITDWHDLLYFVLDIDEGADYTEVDGAQFYWELQTYVLYEHTSDGQTIEHRFVGFVDHLLTMAIIGLLLAIAMIVTRNNTRRKYYISNVVTTCAYSAYNVGFAIWMMIKVSVYKAKFLQINFEQLEMFCTMWKREYNPTTRCCDWGYVLGALLILFSAAVVFNLIWKVTLMKRENKLLSGQVAEVATTVA